MVQMKEATRDQATIEVMVNKKHITSEPFTTDFKELGIEKVAFVYNVYEEGSDSPQRVKEASLYKSANGEEYYRALLYVEPGKQYTISTRVTTTENLTKESDPFIVGTSQDKKFYALEYKIVEGKGDPLEGATYTLNPGQPNERSFESRQDGLVFFSNLTEGEYDFEVAKDGYSTKSGTITVPSDNQTGVYSLTPTS